MNRTLGRAALIVLGILCSVPKSCASDKWEDSDIIGTVAAVLDDGLLLKHVFLKLPDVPLDPGQSYYEYGTGKYTKTNETILVYTRTADFKADDRVAGSVRYRNMHSPDKASKSAATPHAAVPKHNSSADRKNAREKSADKDDKSQVRAFDVFGILSKLDSADDIKGPIAVGGGAKAEGSRAKTFVLFNPITTERVTNADPEAVSQYLSKGWMLESSAHPPQPVSGGAKKEGSRAKTFVLYNPVTTERVTNADPEAVSQYLSKGWLVESTAHTPKPVK